jgi:hypothetical protein
VARIKNGMAFFHFGLTGLLLLSVHSAIPRAQAQEPRQPIRVSVDGVDVGVILTDASGKFVDGLCQNGTESGSPLGLILWNGAPATVYWGQVKFPIG